MPARAANRPRQGSGALLALVLLCAAPPSPALDPGMPGSGARQRIAAGSDSDAYAWRLFVALNSPTPRHEPVAVATRDDDPPARWESWATPAQVFLDDGADPGPWPAAPPELPPSVRFEAQSLKNLENPRHVVAGHMEPVTDPLALAGKLTETRLNRASYDYIRRRELYHLDGQRRAAHDGGIAFPAAARHVKAEWRPIPEAQRQRYHTLTVIHADGRRELYGLTALHVATKDLDTWFWATFEHVDNPTRRGGEPWLLPSIDRHACGSRAPDCNRAPADLRQLGRQWRQYRLRGTMTSYLDPDGRPKLLANSELEAGLQTSSSCMACHARASYAAVGATVLRLPVLLPAPPDSPTTRRGYVGRPDPRWYETLASAAGSPVTSQDFVWALAGAHERADVLVNPRGARRTLLPTVLASRPRPDAAALAEPEFPP